MSPNLVKMGMEDEGIKKEISYLLTEGFLLVIFSKITNLFLKI